MQRVQICRILNSAFPTIPKTIHICIDFFFFLMFHMENLRWDSAKFLSCLLIDGIPWKLEVWKLLLEI